MEGTFFLDHMCLKIVILYFICLIDSLARYRNVGWKTFFLRILKALLYYLLASVAEKSEAILISDFPLSGSL